ncbi:MAG: hypothetical protein JSW55_17365, partial [Chloroflexota bacterium]
LLTGGSGRLLEEARQAGVEQFVYISIVGIARSPHGPITQVLWSADGGQSWSEATLLPPILPNAWTCFDFEWTAERGHHSLMTRATDAAGNSQPMHQPFNQEGYLFNMVYPHKVTVVSR